MGYVFDKEEENSAPLEENNFHTTTQKLLEILDNGVSDDVSLQELTNIINEIKNDLRRGNRPLVLERFSLEELQKLGQGDGKMAEALSIVSGRGVRAGSQVEYEGLQQKINSTDEEVASQARIARDELNEQMEEDIEAYARAVGKLRKHARR